MHTRYELIYCSTQEITRDDLVGYIKAGINLAEY